MNIDLALTQTADGFYDISFTNGDFTLTQGLNTALLMSVFCEKRADSSEVPTPYLQRGWWGNLFSLVLNYEQGSKLWLLYQARQTQNTLNRAVAYAKDAFSWMIQDNLLESLDVAAVYVPQGLQLNVTLFRSQNVVGNFSYELWNNTVGAR